MDIPELFKIAGRLLIYIAFFSLLLWAIVANILRFMSDDSDTSLKPKDKAAENKEI